MHSVHFPDGASLGYDADGAPAIDAFVMVMTPPNAQGEMSFGPGNGVNGDFLEILLRQRDVTLLLYVNAGYPFVRGYKDAPNTVPIEALKSLVGSLLSRGLDLTAR